jgi:hypothetical protein
LPFGDRRARARVDAPVFDREAERRVQEALRHRPGLEARVARDAVCVALGDDLALVHNEDRFDARECRRQLAGECAVDEAFDGGVGHRGRLWRKRHERLGAREGRNENQER